METLVGKICPFCQEPIREGDSVIICPSCNIPHHENCWYSFGGCTTPGCIYHPEQGTYNEPNSANDNYEEIDLSAQFGNSSASSENGVDLSDNFIPAVPNFVDENMSSYTGDNVPYKPKGLNRSITIMSFLEDHIEEGEMNYPIGRDEQLRQGRESLKIMNFTDENAASPYSVKSIESNTGNTASLTKPQQSQHKASLTKPSASSGSGTKANLNKPAREQNNSAQPAKPSLTKPDAKSKSSTPKASLTKSSDKPSLSKGNSPSEKKPSEKKQISTNYSEKPNNINNTAVVVPVDKPNRMTAPESYDVICVQCKKLISSDQQFCPYCGAVQKEKEKPQPLKKAACPNCGSLVRGDQIFCPRCGKKIEEHLTIREAPPTDLVPSEEVDTAVNDAITQFSDTLEQSKHKRRRQLILTGIATLLLVGGVVITMLLTEKKNFSQMYGDIAGENWCTISTDGLSMKIDTNPDDKSDYIESRAYSEIKEINRKLGFSDSIYESMGTTRSVDGERYATFENYKVSWKYHPDTGLEVQYTMQ